MTFMFALARRMALADSSISKGEWDRARFQGLQVHGKTIGIVGLGQVRPPTASWLADKPPPQLARQLAGPLFSQWKCHSPRGTTGRGAFRVACKARQLPG